MRFALQYRVVTWHETTDWIAMGSPNETTNIAGHEVRTLHGSTAFQPGTMVVGTNEVHFVGMVPRSSLAFDEWPGGFSHDPPGTEFFALQTIEIDDLSLIPEQYLLPEPVELGDIFDASGNAASALWNVVGDSGQSSFNLRTAFEFAAQTFADNTSFGGLITTVRKIASIQDTLTTFMDNALGVLDYGITNFETLDPSDFDALSTELFRQSYGDFLAELENQLGTGNTASTIFRSVNIVTDAMDGDPRVELAVNFDLTLQNGGLAIMGADTMRVDGSDNAEIVINPHGGLVEPGRVDIIELLDGNDGFLGSDQNEDVLLGDGNDWAFGGAGSDRLFGDGGNDILMPGTGNDLVWLGDGNDVVRGADIELNGDVIADFVYGDRIEITGVPKAIGLSQISFSGMTLAIDTDFDGAPDVSIEMPNLTDLPDFRVTPLPGPETGIALNIRGSAAPTVTIGDQAVLPGDWLKLDTVLLASDADGDPISWYEVWDSEGGSNWWVDGRFVDATTGFWLTAEELQRTWLQGDAFESTQMLWIRAWDGNQLGEWQSFDLATVDQRPPEVVIDDQSVAFGQWVKLSGIMTATDPNGDVITWYQLWDAQSPNTWWVDGAFVHASNGYWVTAAQLDDVWLQGDVTESSQSLWVRAFDTSAGEWDSFTLTTALPQEPPVATIEDQTLAPFEWAALTDILNVTDTNGDVPTWYHLWDSVGGHNFWVDGDFINASTGHWITASELASTWIQADASNSTQTLYIQAYDTESGPWDSFQLTTSDNIYNLPASVLGGQLSSYSLSTLFGTAFLSDMGAIQQFEIWEDDPNLSFSQFQGDQYFINGPWSGLADSTGHVFDVTQTSLESLRLNSEFGFASGEFWVRASDGSNWDDWVSIEYVVDEAHRLDLGPLGNGNGKSAWGWLSPPEGIAEDTFAFSVPEAADINLLIHTGFDELTRDFFEYELTSSNGSHNFNQIDTVFNGTWILAGEVTPGDYLLDVSLTSDVNATYLYEVSLWIG